MTSKHLFFKAMREDLRHRMWMIALSCLGSFLMLPVAWLINVSNAAAASSIEETFYIGRAMSFFGVYLCTVGTMFAFAGALIVGLAGFRFLFHKNMIDTYHSIPVRRRTLFCVYYLNGLLIWFVPFALGLLISLGMAAGYLSGHNVAAAVTAQMIKEAGLSLIILTVIFLLIYHLLLAAAMLAGNVLNTLVGMVVLGCAAVSICGLCVGLLEMYMTTFYRAPEILDYSLYASPMVSAIGLAVVWVNSIEYDILSFAEIWTPFLINTAVAVLLGLAAYALYVRRPSELAEQGVKNKVMSTLMKLAVGVAAGIGGWMFFIAITENGGAFPGWGVFGALLGGVLAFGIMDIIFSMDFKAFFAHKLQMAIAVAASLLVCFAMCEDWIGFEHYLPDKDDIKEISIYTSTFTNQSMTLRETMHLTDADLNYAFLERMADRGIGRNYNSFSLYVQTAREFSEWGQQVAVKVTLNSGRSYYRNYYMLPEDRDVAWPLFVSEEYLEETYLIPVEDMVDYDNVTFSREYRETRVEDIALEDIKVILEAYNRDVEEDPDGILSGQGILLTRLNVNAVLDGYRHAGNVIYHLDIYDTMVHSVEAIRQAGFGEWVEPIPPEQIERIILTFSNIGDYSQYSGSLQDAMDLVRDSFGVEGTADASSNAELHVYDQYGECYSLADLAAGKPVLEELMAIEVSITDPEEIKELTALLNYNTSYYGNGIFREGFVAVQILDLEGTSRRCCLRRGALPEKYISLFEPALDAMLQMRDQMQE